MIDSEFCRELARDLQDSLSDWFDSEEEEVLEVATKEHILWVLSKDAEDELTSAILTSMEASRTSRDDLPKTLMRVANAIGYVVKGVDPKTARKSEVYRLSLVEATKMFGVLGEGGELQCSVGKCLGEFFAVELAGSFWRMVSSD